MSRLRVAIGENLVLDARRAAWFPHERVLAVADLHLGYAWAHRLGGQLMPIPPANDTLGRLTELQGDYAPSEIVVLGDIVHRAVALDVLKEEIRALLDALAPRSRLTFIAGNHDRHLKKILQQWQMPIDLVESRAVGSDLLIHGDRAIGPQYPGQRVFMGHEHPAITIGDGVTTSHKCPCVLLSPTVVVLPAFSSWAAGTNIRAYPLMSEVARAAKFTHAMAICGDKWLRIPISIASC